MSLDTKVEASAFSKPVRRTLVDATAETIRDAIQSGTYAPGSQLPPELELSSALEVSRTTIREALRLLEEQGFIERRRGLGTFIRDQSIVKDLSLNFGITEMITQAGYEVGAVDVFIRVENADKKISAALDVPMGELLYVIDRVRTANDQRVVWSLDIARASLFPDLDPAASDLSEISIYDYLQSTLGYKITHGQATVRPLLADAEVSARLDVQRGDPVLLIEQTDYDQFDHPLLYSIEYHLPDKFVFLIQRKGPSW